MKSIEVRYWWWVHSTLNLYEKHIEIHPLSLLAILQIQMYNPYNWTPLNIWIFLDPSCEQNKKIEQNSAQNVNIK